MSSPVSVVSAADQAFARPVLHRPDAVPDAESAPAVALLADTLREAAARGASDTHVEPAELGWRIRLRIDGALHVYLKPPLHLRDAFITRVKVLARMDIAERRVPQDGRLRLPLANGEPQDYRVNSLPTLFGEKLVLRRLDSLPEDLSLAALGLAANQQRTVETAIHAPHGLVLVTSPTGSGKTLSLYCFLQMLNAESRNVCSVEDPAEIQLGGINQVSVRDKAPPDLRRRAAGVHAPGSRRHHDGRDPRRRNRGCRGESRADRASGALHAAHQRRARRDRAADRHRRRAVQPALGTAARDGAAARAQALRGLPCAIRSHLRRGFQGPSNHAAARSAMASAIGGGWAFTN
jgi:hypothetical protein